MARAYAILSTMGGKRMASDELQPQSALEALLPPGGRGRYCHWLVATATGCWSRSTRCAGALAHTHALCRSANGQWPMSEPIRANQSQQPVASGPLDPCFPFLPCVLRPICPRGYVCLPMGMLVLTLTLTPTLTPTLTLTLTLILT